MIKMKLRLIILLIFITNLLFAQNFHDTQGKLEISNSGQASYTLPIAMPASTLNVGPSINLVYVSGQNGGIAGQGWNLNSISFISRMSTRQDIDGFRDGVDFDADDKLSIDGQRLLLKAGTGNYWQDGSVYETEVQSNLKVELKGAGSTMYFLVTSPDGTQTWYGNIFGIDATDATAYYIVRSVDIHGNAINYTYSKPMNQSLCIKDITFGSNVNSSTALNKISFTYTALSRTENYFIKGVRNYKTELLNKIEVFTGGLLFKRYQLAHSTDDQAYNRVTQIQEFNSAGEGANPVLFEYVTTSNSVGEITSQYTDNFNVTSAPELSGDFDGDGRLDFITGQQLKTKLFQGGNSTFNFPIAVNARNFVATTLTNNKVNQKQSVVDPIQKVDGIDFKIYNLEENGTVSNYIKNISMNNALGCIDECETSVNPGAACNIAAVPNLSNTFIVGDFNGDTISEVLILGNNGTRVFKEDPVPYDPNSLKNGTTNVTAPGHRGCYWHYTEGDLKARIIDLNPSSSGAENTAGNYEVLGSNLNILLDGQRFVVDFNGDGKSDIMMIQPNGSYKIINFKQLGVAPWVEFEIIGQGFLDSYSTNKQTLFGDFNGDSKPDIMIPVAFGDCWTRPEIKRFDKSGNLIFFQPAIVCPNNDKWDIFYGNPNPAGGEFFTKATFPIVEYRPSTGDHYETQWHNSSYYAMDVNKDGKSDVVRIWTSLYQYSPFWDPKDIDSAWTISTYINNGNGFNLNYSSPTEHNDNDNSRPISLVSNYTYNGLDNDILMIRYHGGNSFDKTVTYLNFDKSFAKDNLLSKVTQSGGAIVDVINYSPMIPSVTADGLGVASDFYSSTESLQYPLIEMKQMASNFLVSRLTNYSLGTTKYQDFKYHGLSVQLNGLGIIGFKKTARSSWWRTTADNVTWSVSENNPLQRGATLKSYTVLSNGSNLFAFSNTYPTGTINATQNNFTETIDVASGRYSILLNDQTTTDYLTNIVTKKIYEYTSDYLLPKKVTNESYEGTTLHGRNIVQTTYDNAFGNGSDYHIGRPSEINTTATVFVNTVSGTPDIKTSTIKYTYTNGDLTKTEKNANNAPETLVEDFVYLPNGLLSSKTISAAGTTSANQVSPRTTSYTYDPTNRFIKTTTDVEGLVSTNLTFDPIYGQVLTQQNPFGQITTSVYDSWGKQTKITDFLGKSIVYNYSKANNIYTTTQSGDDGSASFVDSDALARVIRKGAKDINGNWVQVTTEYDFLGKKLRESEPYFSTATPTQWTTFAYDAYQRPVTTVTHTGKMVSTSYSGLRIDVTDYTLAKSKTMNANGQVVTATDTPGGTINYKFDAMGSLLESNYDGVKISMTYDAWGRKIQLVDTSAGTYNYTFNAFGETLTESTPKGITNFVLSPLGKVLSKRIVGLTNADNTDITSTYTYDTNNKWVTNIAVANLFDGNSNYGYTYDAATKQINGTTETLYSFGTTTPYVTFQKTLTYDVFGRVATEQSKAIAHGKITDKTITHTYKNGAAWQLLDGTTVKWQTNTVNERGQLTGATLGNGIGITNTYDAFGYTTQNKHDLGTVNIMTLDNVFQPTLGNLLSRYNSMFDASESFTYDSLDRLTSWSGGQQTLMNLPFNSGTEGFVFNSTAVNGSATNVAGTMKVVAKNFGRGVKKNLVLNVPNITKLRFKATVSGKMGTPGVLIDAFVVETDPANPTYTNEVFVGQLENGIFDGQYEPSGTYINPSLAIKFVIGENSPYGSNGGGQVNPNSTFFVDNFQVYNIETKTQNYDDRGKITANSVGSYNYTNQAKPYQNTSVEVTPEANAYYQSRPLQNITYNAFKAPIQIEEQNVDKISFGYNAMQQRSIMFYGSTDADKFNRPFRKYYSADGSMEVKYTKATGSVPESVEFLTYIGGGAYTAPAVLKSDGTTPAYFYLHRDYQGSILAISNAVGAVVEKRLFDAWGAIAKVQDGAGNTLTKLTFFDRGYTGHEHLQSVGLINMNARLYDPKLHRFLQPDAFIQDQYNTQNYNRYGYCVNNPLKYTDVTGNVFGLDDAIIIGASIALASYLVGNLISGEPITLKGALMASFIGAVSGAVTFGIGNVAGNIGNFYLRAGFQALAHGTFQGTLSGIQGGGFWAGFASGSLSSIASSAFNGGGVNSNYHGAGKFADSVEGTLFFGAVAGGAGAELTGGNFWQGATTGLIVAALNHVAHKIQEGLDQPKDKIYSGHQILISEKGVVDARINIEYKYKIVDGKKIVIDGSVVINHDFDNSINPIDSYTQNDSDGLKISPLVYTSNDKIVFELVGTHVEGSFSIGTLKQSTGLYKTVYQFTGAVDISKPTNSYSNIRELKSKMF
jgi:RHS repeat-associated protein